MLCRMTARVWVRRPSANHRTRHDRSHVLIGGNVGRVPCWAMKTTDAATDPDGRDGGGLENGQAGSIVKHLMAELAPPALNSNRESIATSNGSLKAAEGSHFDLSEPAKPRKKRSFIWIIALAVVAIVVVAVVVPVYFKVIKKDATSSPSAPTSSAEPTPTATTPTSTVVTSGGDGSTVTKDDGSTFTYVNKFGGYWVFDPANPFNNSARAQSWSPALNEPWSYGVDQIRGVNIGGWLVLEPFISPALYEPYQPEAVDEWTLSEAIAANRSSGGLRAVLEEHYRTFITEEDFAQIAAAGLNWVRIPVPFWAVEKLPDEPFLERVSWTYFLKAIEWCRKYGLRIQVDLHTIPGSQNAFDHSGKRGDINFMRGTMGVANAQRALNVMRSLTEFISRDEYKDVVQMFGVMNEPMSMRIGMDSLTSFYVEMHDMMRNLTGAGKGPWISLHDGFDFSSVTADGFMPGADRLAVASHLYFSFATPLNSAPLAQQTRLPCTQWASRFNSTLDKGIFASAGEWSLGFNDCAYFLNGASAGYRYDGTLSTYTGPRIGSCAPWLDSSNWTDENYFFWTWRIGESSRTGQVNSPLWSYKLGLERGYMPTDPRQAAGTCRNSNPRRQTFTPNTVSNIPASYKSRFRFPPATIVDAPNGVVTYVPTGTPVVMPAPTFTAASVPTAQSGTWAHDYVPLEGCTYPDNWNAVGVAVPRCAAANRRRFAKEMF
ncbi:glucan 1,3-beta-glucosidase D [Ceratobasidium theobromae]|uniref:glucan 1,3-beta-glucosidase n=1 Tax=Ceratobasidium theobromae TaxID=1582974 RepID=A0A5N5QBG5_9AGAM|nr:glucan 1,3-beta-glucosidase D [Ceratobasidium theobromae]